MAELHWIQDAKDCNFIVNNPILGLDIGGWGIDEEDMWDEIIQDYLTP